MSTTQVNASLKDDDTDLLVGSEKEDAQRLSMVDQLCAACKSGDVNNASRLLAAVPERRQGYSTLFGTCTYSTELECHCALLLYIPYTRTAGNGSLITCRR